MTFAVALPSKNTSFLQNMVYMHVVEINLHKTYIDSATTTAYAFNF